MNKPAIIGYNDLEDFKKDFETFRLNPNDRVFMNAVNQRVRMSAPQMQVQIKEEIQCALMESNPQEFVRRVAMQMPAGCWMIIKSQQDPFFEA